MTFAALFVAAKVFSDAVNESVLSGYSAAKIFSYFVGAVGVFGFFLFGAATLIFISRLFDNKPQVILTSEGIEDKRLGCGLITWNEVEMITLEETKYAKWLNLILNSPEKLYKKLSLSQLFLRKLNGQNDKNNFRIRFADLDASVDEAWEFIENNVIKPREEKQELPLMP